MGTPLESALTAELKFYAAFEQGDLDLMMAVWATSADIVCVHPLGSVLVGPSAIRASWAEILAMQVPRKFEIERVQTITTQDLVLHLVYESITLPL
ncbi:MAG: YybH family protein, partial [Gammaproteobacteria bacterium]